MGRNDEAVRYATLVAMPALVEHAPCYCGQDDDGDLSFAIVYRDRRMPPEYEGPNCSRACYCLGPRADGIQGCGCDDAGIEQHAEAEVALYEVPLGRVALACTHYAPQRPHGALEVPHGAG
jgi:hypothetical protein